MVAKFSVLVVNGTSILISIFFSAIVLIFRVELSKLFTSDSQVIEAVSGLTPLLAISVFLNGIQPILSGKPTQQKCISFDKFLGVESIKSDVVF